MIKWRGFKKTFNKHDQTKFEDHLNQRNSRKENLLTAKATKQDQQCQVVGHSMFLLKLMNL